MTYIAGMGPENGCVIVDKTGTTLYTDMRYMEAAEKLYAGTNVTPKMLNRTEIMTRLAGYENVGISFDQTKHVEYLALEKAGVKLQNIVSTFTEDGSYHGIIRVQGSGTLTLDNATITKCTAPYGMVGGVSGATYNIKNCTFNGNFGNEGAITIQNNKDVNITVNVADCAFNNIPETSHEIFVLYAFDGWTLNAEGITAFCANR